MNEPDQSSRTSVAVRRLRRLVWAVAALLLGAILVVAFHRPLLTSAARAWVVNSVIEPADAILVLGGGMDSRPAAAAALFLRGIAPFILIPRNSATHLEITGVLPSNAELTRQLLLRKGVPESRIRLIGTDCDSTRDELLALRDWIHQEKARRILVPTDLFHTRRVDWFGNHVLESSGARLYVMAVRNRRFSESDWWTGEEGLIQFQNELVKTALYRFRYWSPSPTPNQ